jgi:hypothetical protein
VDRQQATSPGLGQKRKKASSAPELGSVTEMDSKSAKKTADAEPFFDDDEEDERATVTRLNKQRRHQEEDRRKQREWVRYHHLHTPSTSSRFWVEVKHCDQASSMHEFIRLDLI